MARHEGQSPPNGKLDHDNMTLEVLGMVMDLPIDLIAQRERTERRPASGARRRSV
jgi:hypothetical protein